MEAAPSTEGSHYALAQIRGAKITSGQDVLVYGASGAIGSAAVQLLKNLGVTVTAVCGRENLDRVLGLGADRVIDYTSEDFTQDHQTYDVVLDAVGKSSFTQCRPILKPAGIYISPSSVAMPRTLSGRSSLRFSGGTGPVPDPEARPGDDALSPGPGRVRGRSRR